MYSAHHNNKKDPLATCGFLLTINTNKAPKSEKGVKDMKRVLRRGLRRLLSQFDDFIDISRYDDIYNTPLKSVRLLDVGRGLFVDPNIEIGEDRHMIHSHTMMNWSAPVKYSFRVNIKKLRRWLDRNIQPGMYVNVRFIKGNQDIIRYIRKQQ